MSSNAFVQQVFDDFSDVVVDFVGRADRTTLQATLFDVPRRTEVALPCYTSILPRFYREIAELIDPDELGRRMRRLGLRPNPLHIDGAHWQILIERERRILLDLPPYPAGDLEFVFDYTGRVLAACRLDGSPFPCGRVGWHMQMMDEDVLAPILAQAREWAEGDIRAMRRLVASLELYAFMLHGEHRDGIFDHGPYEVGDGELAMVKDFSDCQNTFLPWSTPDVRLPYPAISVVSVLDAVVEPRVNWVGTTVYSGCDPYDHLRRAAVLYVRDAVPRPLDRSEWDAVAAAAREAQKKLFMRIAQWPQEQKVKYGMWLFANHLYAVASILGVEARITDWVVPTFQSCVDAQYERLDLANPSPVWAALRRERPFTPLQEVPG